MSDSVDQAYGLADMPAITESALHRAIRRVTAPMRGLRWQRIVPATLALGAVATVLTAALVIDSPPWTLLADGFLALERALTR